MAAQAVGLPVTIEDFFGVNPLTHRDIQANRLDTLLSLAAPRPDTPTALGSPAATPALVMKMGVADLSTITAAKPSDTVDQGTLPVILTM